jgi:molecular chaperone DnaJ
MKKDYYSILGVSKNATKDEIKKAYKKRARETHPDQHPDKEEEFKDVAEAWETLGDDKKRAEYDNPVSGFSGFDGNPFGGFDPFGFWSHSERSNIVPGEDVHVTLNISVDDLYELREKTIRYSYKKRCTQCESSNNRTTCSACHGTGFVTETIRNGFSIIQNRTTCSACHGTGKIVKNHCSNCNDTGFTNNLGKFNFNIRDYTNYLYKSSEINFNVGQFGSEGENKNSPNGNLIVHVKRDFDKTWEIRNNILYHKLEIDVFKMLGGGSEQVSLPNDKKLKIQIKPCSQSCQLLSIPNHGLLDNSGERDNLIVELIPRFPQKLSEKQINIIKENFI